MHGKAVHSFGHSTLSEAKATSSGMETVAYEARKIKAIILSLANFEQ